MRKKLFTYGLVLAVVPCAQAGPVTIDFESLLDMETVSSQFSGLVFHGSAVARSSGGSLSPSFPPLSGDTVIFDDPNSSMPGVVRIDADGGTFGMASGYVTTFAPGGVTLRAFDAGGALIASASTPAFGQPGFGTPNVLLSVVAGGIAYVTFSDSGNEFSVDDFTYETELPGIPLPSAASLGLAALFLTTAGRRRAEGRGLACLSSRDLSPTFVQK